MKRFGIRAFGLAVAFATLVVCGGSGAFDGVFPLTSSVPLNVSNLNAQEVNVFLNGEMAGAANLVAPGQQQFRNSASTYLWSTDDSVQTLTVTASRNGTIIDTESVTMTGQERHNNQQLQITWNTSDQLVVDKL